MWTAEQPMQVLNASEKKKPDTWRSSFIITPVWSKCNTEAQRSFSKRATWNCHLFDRFKGHHWKRSKKLRHQFENYFRPSKSIEKSFRKTSQMRWKNFSNFQIFLRFSDKLKYWDKYLTRCPAPAGYFFALHFYWSRLSKRWKDLFNFHSICYDSF